MGMIAPVFESPVQAPTLPEVRLAPEEHDLSEAELDPPHRIVIHNDDVTPMDFVVHVLTGIFELKRVDAEVVMLTAHFTGQAHVQTIGLEEAKYRVGQAHGLARANNYPLTFTIEPEG